MKFAKLFRIKISHIISIAVSMASLITISQAAIIELSPSKDLYLSGQQQEGGLGIDGADACILSGEIAKGDYEIISKYIGMRKSALERKSIKCEIVYLNSNGGDFSESLKIMDYFHSSMIATSVEDNATCLSACAIIWLGGARADGHSLDDPRAYRRLSPNGKLGFHAPFPSLPSKSYTNEEVKIAFLEAFNISQALLKKFQEKRIPGWFAASLMHPKSDEFLFIDNINKANLIRATIPLESKYYNIFSRNMLYRACLNMSAWGKEYITASNIRLSSHEGFVDGNRAYIESIKSGSFNILNRPKDYAGLEYFLNETGIDQESSPKVNLLKQKLQAMELDENTNAFWQDGINKLSPDYKLVDNAVLSWNENKYGDNEYWFIMPSPGVVGPHDENLRDRAEFCMITLSKSSLFGPGAYTTRISESSNSINKTISMRTYGTEFSRFQELDFLPASLLAIPGDTKLTDITRYLNQESLLPSAISPSPASNITTNNMNSYSSPQVANYTDAPNTIPDWCSKAHTLVEVTICSNSQLAALDLRFASIFKEKKTAYEFKAREISKDMRAQRNACGNNRDCIFSAYSTALDKLHDLQ